MKPHHLLLFEALLRAFPLPFRERYGEGMRESFEARYAECADEAGNRLTPFLWRTTVDMIRASLRERLCPTFGRGPAWNPRGRRLGWRGAVCVLIEDLRFALRSLWLRPGFALIAVLTLALGIGANTAIFSVVQGVLLAPLPYEEPNELVAVNVRMRDGSRSFMSYPDLADVGSGSHALEALIGYRVWPMTLTGRGDPVVVDVNGVTDGLMDLFHLEPLLGRDLGADESGVEATRVAVLSHAFWQSRFGRDEQVLDRSVMLDGESYRVVGVAPQGFAFPQSAQIWIPRSLKADCGRRCYTMETVGRLAEGATIDELRRDVEATALHLEATYPDTNTGRHFMVQSLEDQVVGEVRPGLWLVLGAVGVVLLIACANVANLLLARASTRTVEMAVRNVLGASRRRMAAHVFVESGLIAVLGGGAGLVFAALGVRALPRLSGGSIPRIDNISINEPVLLFTLGTTLLVTVLFGTAAAIGAVRASTGADLKGCAGGWEGGRRRGCSWRLLLGGEVALSAILLVAAGLLFRSFTHLYAVDVGFETHEILRFNLSLPHARYDRLEEVRTFYRTLEDRIRAIPGVEAVGSVSRPPLGEGHASARILLDGQPDPKPSEETRSAVYAVGPGWMETMRIPIVRGRGLVRDDDCCEEPVALVNETFVRENFPGREAIGEKFRAPLDLGFGAPPWKIVGIVADTRSRALQLEAAAAIYVPHGQYGPSNMTVTVRGAAGAPPLLPAIREEVGRIDAGLPLYGIETVEEALRREIAPTRFYLVLVGLFAGLAALLAAVGLYGVVAYVVSRRAREIGLRVALGARRHGIVRMVLGQGMRPTLLGLGVGLGAAFFGGQPMKAVLHGVKPRDPLTFAATAVLLVVVALAATVLPAYQATRVDPVDALRPD